MSAPRNSGSDEFRKLDAFMAQLVLEEIEEDAFEWLSLLTNDDWHLIESTWCERSPDWRARLVCIVGEFPRPLSQAMVKILRHGVVDSETLVAENAAIWLASRMLAHPELVPFDRALILRFRELLRGPGGGVMSEVGEVMRRYAEAE